jgi:predicted PurR-regulated permease PerM/methylmalonyl-CoA mutase cobalamin-binding subunit
MATFKSNQANSAIIGIYTLQMMVFVLGTLYFGQDIIIPLSLAILLTFLLSPLVRNMERWIGRIAAVLIVVITLFILVSVIGYILSLEFIDLKAQLPGYKGNIETKLQSISFLKNAFFADILAKFQNLSNLTIPANVVNTSAITATAQSVISSLVHALINIGFVMLLVIFMLFNREDLRSRIIRLIGEGRIGATTLAMDDAADRISHYLLMQLIINCCFGVALTLGLYFIGVPNASLWGGLLIVLRFIPYIGTWVAACIPIILSFVISASWMTPLFTIALYLSLDLVSTNFLEPYLYGASTGISSTALIIAAVFWTLLWGPVGLLLAIPLTVCFVVLGRHVPQLEFLSILLGDNKALELHEEYYHRLLTEDQNDVIPFVEKYIKENSLISLYDAVMVPLIIKIETDLSSEALDPEKAQVLYQGIRDIVENLNEAPTPNTDPENQPKQFSGSSCKILCLPLKDSKDEIAAEMLSQMLKQHGFNTTNIPLGLDDTQIFNLTLQSEANVICITATPPCTLLHIRNICKKIHLQNTTTKIIICLLGGKKVENENNKKSLSINVNATARSLAETLELLEGFAEGNAK